MFEQLKAILPQAKFYPPATAVEIERAEKALKFKMPDWLCELYRKCNGIKGDGETYLFPLKKRGVGKEGLVSWNRFIRNEWDCNFPDLVECRPEIDWTKCDPNPFLMISTSDGMSSWAIKPGQSHQIYDYYVQSEGEAPAVIAENFVEACAAVAKRIKEFEEDYCRGRAFYSPRSDRQRPRDIDRLYRQLINPSQNPFGPEANVGWHMKRGISQRPHEKGELYILNIGPEIGRLISRDGNCPFIMRLKVWSKKKERSCVVWNLNDALLRLEAAEKLVSLHWKNGKRPKPDISALRRVWKSTGNEDRELEEIADILCARDDCRRQHDNKMGLHAHVPYLSNSQFR